MGLFKKTIFDEKKHWFLISSPRSGSTWVKTSLNCHPDIFCSEMRLFGDYAGIWSDKTRGSKGLRVTMDAYLSSLSGPFDFNLLDFKANEFIDEMVRKFSETLIETSLKQSGKRVFVDKVTPYLGTSDKVIRSIKRVFPNAGIIFLNRDGRDVLTSGVFDWLGKTKDLKGLSDFQKFRYDAFASEENPKKLSYFFDKKEIKDWANRWLEPSLAIKPHADLVISYENLSNDYENEIKKIFQTLRVSDSSEVIEKASSNASFKSMSGGREKGDAVATAKVRKGIVGDWCSYFTRDDGRLFDEFAGDELISSGYESDSSWIKKLPVKLN